VLACTWADAGADLYAPVLAWLSERLSFYFGVQTVGMLKAAGSAYPVGGRAELLQQAFEVGTRLA
jgi:hypothetical protein